jgi:hypothetical protein
MREGGGAGRARPADSFLTGPRQNGNGGPGGGSAERPPHRSFRARLTIQLAGWGFLLLGVLGLVLPILQGFLFLLVGLYILSLEVEWAKRLRAWLIDRFPQAGRKVEEAEARANAWFEKHRKAVNDGLNNLKTRINGGRR